MTLKVLTANGVTRALRSDHDNIDILRRDDLLVVNVKAVSECQNVARLQVRLYNFLVDVSLLLVRYQHHDDVASLSSLSRSHDGQTALLSLSLVLGARAQTYNNVYAGIMQVQRMCVTLRTEADNCYGLAVQNTQVAVGIIIHVNHFHILLITITYENILKTNSERESRSLQINFWCACPCTSQSRPCGRTQ